MVLHAQAFAANGRGNPLFWPICISFGLHLLFAGLMLYTPNWNSEQDFMPSVIDVRMVELSDRTASPVPKGESPKELAPAVEQSKAEDIKPADTPAPEADKPEVSVAPTRKKTKTALKYKTFKTEAVKKKALKQLKQKVQASTPRPLQDRFKELREKVDKEGKPSGQEEPVAKEGAQSGTGGFAPGGKKAMELIEMYQLEVAFEINKNWAYSELLSGRGNTLRAKIAFKVLPDGKITDIFFTDRSGDPYLDESVHKAIVKSSPVKPHPAKLRRPYVEMGLIVTPQGLE